MSKHTGASTTITPRSEEFLGKRVIITGATSPTGIAIVDRFARGGAYVVVADTDIALAREVASGIVGALALEVDPNRETDVSTMASETRKALGGVDILINNFVRPIDHRPTGDIGPEDFDAAINQNVRGVFLSCKYVVPTMPPGSTVVNVIPTSNSRNTSPLWEAVKGSLMTMTRGLAWELAPGIRFNAVCPVEEVDEGDSSLLHRSITVDDVAAAVCFLASSRSEFLAGVCLNVDGGAGVR